MRYAFLPSTRSSSFLVPGPGTQYHTSATSLRKQNSKLPFKRRYARGMTPSPVPPHA